MKKKLGFTLIELLGVITILGLLVVITVPTVDRVIKNYKGELYDTQIGNIELAARNWGADHKGELPKIEGEQITIDLLTLKKGGYIAKDIKDPRNEKFFANTLTIKIVKTNNTYTYEVERQSGSLEEQPPLS